MAVGRSQVLVNSLGWAPKFTRLEMQLSDLQRRRIDIWEQMRKIEGELFLLSEGPGERDLEKRLHFQRLCPERTQTGEQVVARRASLGVSKQLPEIRPE